MYQCDDEHEQVTYTCDTCPACAQKQDRREADRRVAVVEEKLQDAERRIEDYRTELGL